MKQLGRVELDETRIWDGGCDLRTWKKQVCRSRDNPMAGPTMRALLHRRFLETLLMGRS
jgi:hypothetical protein